MALGGDGGGGGSDGGDGDGCGAVWRMATVFVLLVIAPGLMTSLLARSVQDISWDGAFGTAHQE